jgi:protein involved in polysaccharide export with SLBB domain
LVAVTPQRSTGGCIVKYRTAGLALVVLLSGSAFTRVGAQQRQAQGFQVGDRVLLQVEGDSVLSDTFSVIAGPALRLPVVGDIPLAGVRRADVEAHLTKQLGHYLNNPVVRARALIRLSVLGQVLHPGFYAVPADLVLVDALMLAGGPLPDARVERLRIDRDGGPIWAGDRLQKEIARGATVDDLGLRAGDRLVVPRQGRDIESTVRIIGVLVTIPVAACIISRGC